MTEQEWRAAYNYESMLHFLEGRASPRKLRLFASACCRRVELLLPDKRCLAALDVNERFADGLASAGELASAMALAEAAFEALGLKAVYRSKAGASAWAVWAALRHGQVMEHAGRRIEGWEWPAAAARLAGVASHRRRRGDAEHDRAALDERSRQCDILRDIFGNPFNPITLTAAWLTPTVLALAPAAYENRILPAGTLDPARLAVLSDGLEEAGCTSNELHEHLRSAGPHVRGCWALDLILGKE